MQIARFYDQNYLQKLTSDFFLFELSVWLHAVASGLVSVFIPILLLQIGFSIPVVIGYYIVYNLFDVPLNLVADKLVRIFGARWMIVAGTLFAALFFVILNAIEPGNLMLLLTLAIVAAIYDALYWVAHVFLFIKSNKKGGDVGKKTGLFYIARRLGSVAAPLVGAALLIFASKGALLWVGVIIFVLSLIPLIWVDDFSDMPEQEWVSWRTFFKAPEERNNYLTMVLFSMNRAAENVIWPMFIFITFGSIASVAFIPLVTGASTVGFAYFASKAKKTFRNRAIIVGAALIACTWVMRIFIEADWVYYVSILLVGFFTLLVTIPLDSNIFARAHTVGPLQTATMRNTTSMFGAFLFYATLGFFVYIFDASFVLAIIGTLGVIVLNALYLMTKGKGAL